MARVKDAPSNDTCTTGCRDVPKPSSLTVTDGCIGIAASGKGTKRSLIRLCIQRRETYASRDFASNKHNICDLFVIISYAKDLGSCARF